VIFEVLGVGPRRLTEEGGHSVLLQVFLGEFKLIGIRFCEILWGRSPVNGME
jgi:hypothetical protein